MMDRDGSLPRDAQIAILAATRLARTFLDSGKTAKEM